MRKFITPDLLVSPKQREEVGTANDFNDRLRASFLRLATVAGRVCVYPATNEDLPGYMKMYGEHTASDWRALGPDIRSRSVIHGRLHLNVSDVAGSEIRTILAESKLVALGKEALVESSGGEMVCMAGQIEGDSLVRASIGSQPRVSLHQAPYLLPVAENMVYRFDQAYPDYEA